MKKFIALALVLGLTACAAPKHYLIKDVPEEQRIRDDAKCQNEAMKIDTADYEYRGTFMEGANIQSKQARAYDNCMIAEGYDRVEEKDLESYRQRKLAERDAASAKKTQTKRATRRR